MRADPDLCFLERVGRPDVTALTADQGGGVGVGGGGGGGGGTGAGIVAGAGTGAGAEAAESISDTAERYEHTKWCPPADGPLKAELGIPVLPGPDPFRVLQHTRWSIVVDHLVGVKPWTG